MSQRGRKSAADRAAEPVVAFEKRPPQPPSELTAEQAREWSDIVERLPHDWIKREHYSLLVQYCRHVERARMLAREIERCPDDGLRMADGLAHFDKLAKCAERETRAMLAIARSLRLTHQAQLLPGRAATQARGPRKPSWVRD